MLDQPETKNPHARARRACVYARSLARYVILGAVALSVLPAQAFAALPLLLAAHTQDDAAKTTGSANGSPSRLKGNTRPFRQWLDKAKRFRDDGSLDLSRTIELSFEADVDEGSLKNVSPVSATPDTPHLRELGADFVAALSESNLLGSFEAVHHLRVALRLDASRLTANFVGDTDSEQRAAIMAQGYTALVLAARVGDRKPEMRPVFNGMTVSANGKQVAFRLEMSRADAGNLLFKQITPN